VDGRLAKAPHVLEVIWRPSPPGWWLKSTWMGQIFGGLGLTSCVNVIRTCRAFVNGYFAIPLVFCLLSRLSWLLMSMGLSMPGVLVGGGCGWRATQLTW